MRPVELLLDIRRDAPQTLGAQIEDGLRQAIRDGALHAGAPIPSTRDLARQLGVSRRITVDAYAQLAAEGYLALRQGARPRVADVAVGDRSAIVAERAEPPPRFDFRPSMPDVTGFPRAAWLRSVREAVRTITDFDLGYGDPRGMEPLRVALVEYFGRVRGLVADAGSVVITSGYSQALNVVCQALAAEGAKRIVVEDPSNLLQREIAARAGLEAIGVGVDADGIRVADLPPADAVVVTPAHQHPTGALLSPARRAALVAWLRDHDAIAIEDDYDAEFRYDRPAVGALQGLDPERVIYAGSVSKTLAPALRLGWLVVPAALVERVGAEKMLADRGTSRIDQLAFADFLGRGELDRHLRRMRGRYRARRDAMIDVLAEALPAAEVLGIAAGLHVTVRLEGVDEDALRAAATERRIVFETMRDYDADDGTLTLLLGYAPLPEPTIRAGVRELAGLVELVA
ncbi:MAG TPA: PLP-dependent aminotransferase family protein [Solirubrobacteraceae bacterium]|nr:PLP-dependent aminotransferase family protein [Solirubrobacteraceae bacterium]